MTLSNGGKTVTPSGAASWQTLRGSISKTSGKLYVEFATDPTYANGQPYIGLANAGFDITHYLGAVNYSAGIAYQSTAVSAGFTSNYSTLQYQVANDVWAMAVDFATGSVWIAKNNVWINSSNPATATAPVVWFVPATVGALFPGMSFFSSGNGVWLPSNPPPPARPTPRRPASQHGMLPQRRRRRACGHQATPPPTA